MVRPNYTLFDLFILFDMKVGVDMKKKLGDITIRELEDYCHNTSCQHCDFRKENHECYNMQDLFNEIDFYDEHELEIEVAENDKN